MIVGAAFSADLHADGYARIQQKVEIVAIVDKVLDRAHTLAKKYALKNYNSYDDFEIAITEVDCDMVDVCMPNFLHHPVTMAALKKGRNVICEKPRPQQSRMLGRWLRQPGPW